MTMYESALARAHELAPQIREDAATVPLTLYRITNDGRIEKCDPESVDLTDATLKTGWIQSSVEYVILGVGIPKGAPADFDPGHILVDSVE